MFLLAYLASFVGTLGVSTERLEASPLGGWRRALQGFSYYLARAMYFAMGLHYVNVKGERVREEAGLKMWDRG